MEGTVHQGVESYSHPLDIHILRRKQNPGSKQILKQLITFTEMKRCFSLKSNLRRTFSIQYMFVNFIRNLEQVKLEQNSKIRN